MSRDLYVDGTEARNAWAAGRAVCPECQRFGCRGQCGCKCLGCKKTPVADWSSGDCDVIREMRRCSSPEGREAYKREYREQMAGAGGDRVTWGECVAQVERCGCPHRTASTARKPEPRLTLEGAKRWWGLTRGAKPSLLLSGGTGTGKSVAAAHVAAKYAEARRWWVSSAGGQKTPLVWVVADELARLSLLRDEDENLISKAEAAEFLVIDELGVTGGKAGLLALGQLIARRLDSGRLTVITTNAKGSDMSSAFGAHVVDRLKTAHLVKTEDKSMRGYT